MAKNGKHNGGRPKKVIDWTQFDSLCAIQCTLGEIALFFNVSGDTIERRVREEQHVSFAEYFSKKRVGGLITLRRRLFQQTEKSPAVLIFCAKNWLGMRDVQEITTPKGQPIEVRSVDDIHSATDEELAVLAAQRIANGGQG